MNSFVTAEWLALDIETGGGRPEAAEQWMARQWEPNPHWKPETIGQRYLDMLGKKKDRLALLDASQVIAISIRSPAQIALFHSMRPEPVRPVEGAYVQGFASEGEMLMALRSFLGLRTSRETLLVGHNIIQFDLPRLRLGFLRNGLQVPAQLADPDQPLYDTMSQFCRRFSAENGSSMISLDEVMTRFGMANHKSTLSGGEVPELFAKGDFEPIVRYALLDVIAEAELFLRMTGKSTNLA